MLEFIILFFVTMLASCTASQSKAPQTLVVEDLDLVPLVDKQRQRSSYEFSSKNSMVVTAERLATEAGVKMLQSGGNAIDAAVAASFTISVTRPHSTGIGGGGFLLIHNPLDKTTKAFDFRERAPLKATRDMYQKPGLAEDSSLNGYLSVGTPGLVKGLLDLHQRYGKLPLPSVMEPSISAAKIGFKIYPTLAEALKVREEVLRKFPGSKAVFFKNDQILKLGDHLIQEDLAKTVTEISRQGSKAFYSGRIARAIIKDVSLHNGLLTLEDLSKYRMIERPVLDCEVKGFLIKTMPAPSSGGIHLCQILMMLQDNVSEIKLTGMKSTQSIHMVAESMRRAFADRAKYLGDPDFVKVPTQQLLLPNYIATLDSSIVRNQATKSLSLQNPNFLLPSALPNESDQTTHLSIVDAQGMVVSTTQTVNYLFGSGVVVPGTGVLLNNEMDDFSTKPGLANVFGLVQGESNSIAPNKTPLSSMTPTIVFDSNEKFRLTLGSPGGPRIISAVTLVAFRNLFLNQSLLQAVHGYRLHHQWLPDEIRIEKGNLSEAVIKDLKAMGHAINESTSIGEVQAIEKTPSGWLNGVSDPRAEGIPLGL
jgi:gamma-glutamyltranspeptidase/glutathione hydrolase